jgi:polar amino acid transport system substrate-binding protein
MRKLLISVLVAVFTLGLVGTAAADTVAEIIKRGELRVACQTQGPPFSFVDKNGKRTGAAVEIVRMMAEEMGVKVKLMNYDWDGLIPALLAKKADILAADMTPTLKRALVVSFTKSYYDTYTAFFMKKGGNFKSLKDIDQPGVRVAVLLGSNGEADAKKLLKRAEIKSYKGGGPMLINAVLSGKADLVFNDFVSIVAQAADFPPNSLEAVPGKFAESPLSFAIRAKDTHLLRWANLFFEWIRLDGRLQELMDYWVNSLEWRKDH